ncbi:hypothetical protein FHT78_002957 [Rhizobium sp. BK196]|nr:hypothetical protein [Rhizobium sp. BK196]MBB3460227.1 hypothetical protein [Rhizobium sp. BK377]
MEFVAETPSPTPPHKGEGLLRLNLGAPFEAIRWHRQSSPSPLWGGVGEGTFPLVGGST